MQTGKLAKLVGQQKIDTESAWTTRKTSRWGKEEMRAPTAASANRNKAKAGRRRESHGVVWFPSLCPGLSRKFGGM